MADQDRIVPWFPDVDLDAPAAAPPRAPRQAGRPLGSRRRPAATGEEPASRTVRGGSRGLAGHDPGDPGDPGDHGLVDGAGYPGDDDYRRAFRNRGNLRSDIATDDIATDDIATDGGFADGGFADGDKAEGHGVPAAPAWSLGGPGAGRAPDRSVEPRTLLPALPAGPRPVQAAGPARSHPGRPTGTEGAPRWSAAPGQDLLDPRVAARRFADLLADADRVRSEQEARQRAGHEDAQALAESYRDAADDVRRRVRSAWKQVAESLAPFGVDDLSQVRVDAADGEALPGIGSGVEPAGERGGRRSRRARRDLAAADRRAPAPAARPGRRAGGGGGGWLEAEPTMEPTVTGDGKTDDGPLDVAAEVAQARQLCMRALATAAELRGVQRASSSLSVGLVTVGSCVLVGLLAAAARMFLDTDGLPCLAAGLIAGGALVTVATEGAGVKAAVRSALLSAGTAGAVVLATARVAPTAPVAIILSLASLAAAVRFGLGFGASKPQSPPAGASPGRRRK